MKEIRKIIAAYDALDHSREKVVLASVVFVEESSYRRIGARMLVHSNGKWTGGISGGCLEGDALRRSQKAIFQNRPARVVYDTLDDDEQQIGVGLGCNGRIEVLFTPIDPTDPDNEIEQLRRIVPAREPVVLLKLIATDGPVDSLGTTRFVEPAMAPQRFADLPADFVQTQVELAFTRRRNVVFSAATAAGVQQRVLVEFLRPETQLVLVGDNYDIHAFAGIARELGWNLTIVCRRKKLPKAIYQLAQAVYEYEEAAQVPVNAYTAVVLMTHDYKRDKQLLPVFLAQQPAYLGMLGPRKRMHKMDTELSGLDFVGTPDFFSPVGLDIGAESPEEIALAIAAEIIMHLRGQQGTPLRDKEGAIHARKDAIVR